MAAAASALQEFAGRAACAALAYSAVHHAPHTAAAAAALVLRGCLPYSIFCRTDVASWQRELVEGP